MSGNQEIFRKYEQKIFEYQNHMEGLNSTKGEYKELIDTLTHLPDTLQPKIMVPLGKLAFFEGNLKSTNEILILLGDNYFAKRSSKQTIDIIQRRDKDIDNTIKDLKEQIKALKQRITLTTDLSKAMHEKDNIIEIKEEYDSDEEREKEKKRNQPKQTTTTTTSTKNNNTTAPKELSESEKLKKQETDQEFDKMLARLSILEEKESKMGEDYDEEDFNKRFNKKLNVADDEEEENDDDFEFEKQDDDEDVNDEIIEFDEDDQDEYDSGNGNTNGSGSGFGKRKSKFDQEYTSNQYDDTEYYNPNQSIGDVNDGEEEEEIIEYYDEDGNIVDINDPNIEYIQDEKEIDDFNETDLEAIKQEFHMDKTGQQILDEKEDKELKDFYHSKQKKRISYIDTPQPPTPDSPVTTKPKSILKTNSSNNLISNDDNQISENNDENDVKRYIKNLGKQDLFENHKTISIPNPPKDRAFSGDIIEKQTDLFPFDDIPKKPTTNTGGKQSRFKSSRQNK